MLSISELNTKTLMDSLVLHEVLHLNTLGTNYYYFDRLMISCIV